MVNGIKQGERDRELEGERGREKQWSLSIDQLICRSKRKMKGKQRKTKENKYLLKRKF